jgi:hypothetical protein
LVSPATRYRESACAVVRFKMAHPPSDPTFAAATPVLLSTQPNTVQWPTVLPPHKLLMFRTQRGDRGGVWSARRTEEVAVRLAPAFKRERPRDARGWAFGGAGVRAERADGGSLGAWG